MTYCGKTYCRLAGKVWHIPLLGAIIAATTAVQGIMDPFSVVLWVSWLLHPFVVTWGSARCRVRCRNVACTLDEILRGIS